MKRGSELSDSGLVREFPIDGGDQAHKVVHPAGRHSVRILLGLTVIETPVIESRKGHGPSTQVLAERPQRQLWPAQACPGL